MRLSSSDSRLIDSIELPATQEKTLQIGLLAIPDRPGGLGIVGDLIGWSGIIRAKIKVLALDLERTLIDNALSGRPRPGLPDFLEFCHERFERVAIFTTVEEAEARQVVEDLADRGQVSPELLDRLEYVAWSGEFKDLSFIPGVAIHEVLLVDDDAGWVQPDQREQWVAISPWDGGRDAELSRVRTALERLLGGSSTDVSPSAH